MGEAVTAGKPPKPTGASTRTAVLAGVGVVVILALAFFIATFIPPVLQTNDVLRDLHAARTEINIGMTPHEDQKWSEVKAWHSGWPHRGDVHGSSGYRGDVWLLEAGKTALTRLGGAKRTGPRLRLYLRLPGWCAPYRPEAAHLLAYCGPRATEPLLGALGNADAEVRAEAAFALGRIISDEKAARVERALVKALSDADVWVCRNAAAALASFWRLESEAATEALIRLLADADVYVRRYAALALARGGQPGEEALEALIRSLGDKDLDVWLPTVEALGKIGPAAKVAIPALEKALEDKDGFVRQAAREALGKIRRAE